MVLKLWKTYFALLSLLCSHFLSGQCLESYSWEFSPQQVDGAWGNEEVVNVCLILTHEDWQGGNHYLHSIIPEFGTGWDLGSIEYIPPLSCSNDGGYWAWYDNPITSEASGVINGPGFYYESPLGGTDPDNPGDNFGDRCPIGLQLEFCFQLTTLSYDECTDDLDLDISINTLSDDESGGAFLSAICQDDEEPILTADINCCNANAGEDLELSFCTDGPEESINEYLSTNNSGLWYYQSLDNPALGDFLTFSPGNDPDGTYLFVVSDELNECNDIAFVSIDTQDGYEAGVSGSTVICENGSIVYLFDILGSNAESGGEWTDPNGIPWNEPFSPSNDIAGEYTYSFPSAGSCPADEAIVDVILLMNADAGENSSHTLCSCEGALSLLSLLDGTPQSGGIWSDQEGNTVPGQFDPSSDLPGQYTYTIQNENCADAATLDIEIQYVGDVGNGGEFTICESSSTIDLFDLLSGDAEQGGVWTSPNGTPISSLLDPTSAENGTYTYSFDCDACSSQSILELTFVPVPFVDIVGNVYQCTQGSFELTFSASSSELFDIIVIDGNGNEFTFSSVINGQSLEFVTESSTTYSIYQAEIEGFIGCDINTGPGAIINIASPPSASLVGAATICPGQSLDLLPILSGNGPFLLEVFSSASGVSFISDPISEDEGVTVFPTIDTEYSILQVWDSSDSVCTSSGNGLFDVNIGSAPTASISGGGLICGGGNGTGQFTVDGEWDIYDITIEASFGEFSIEGVANGEIVEFPAPNSLTYCLSEVSPSGSTGCNAILTDTCMEFQVLPNLITYSLNVECDLSSQLGTISFTIQGGSGNYFVDGDPVDGNVFTSAEVSNGSEFSFIVSDDIGCTVIRSGTVECECLFSSAGEFTQATDTLNACIGENIEVIYDDSNEVLDPNDTRTFIIHDGDSNAIGNTLLVFSDISSGISFDPILNEDVVYWLTAVIANEDDNGIADLNDVCLSAASGIGIRFRSSPTASLSGSAAICAGEEAIFEIDLEGNGPWTVNVDLQGNPFAEYITDLSPLIVQTSQEGEYVVSSISDQYCNGVANGAVQVDIQALPSASISQGGEFCEGSGEGPLVEFTGDGPWELNYTVNGILDSIVIGNTPDVIPVFSGGTYSLVSVSDSNCDNDASGSVQVDMIPAPQAILTAGNPVCVGDSVPILIEFINGNFWSYSLSFDGSNSDTLTNSTGSTIIHASTSGNIELLYLENESCGAYEFPNTEIEIYELPSIEYSLSGDSICSGELVELTIESQGNIGLVEVELLINSDLQFISVSSEQWTASFFPEEDFNLTIGPVQDQITGCVDTTLIQFNVEVTEYPEVNPLDDHIVCSLDSTLLSTMAEEGVVYQWYAGGELLPSDNSSVSLSLENLTNESIEVDVLLVADRIGCITQELSHFIVDPLPEVLFSYNPQPVSAVNPVINLINLSAGSNTYLWTLDGDTLSNDISPSWLLEPDNPDEYIICLEATSSKAGCKNTFCMEVEILGDLSVYIPNSFSPNGDGLNDEFGPEILNADLRFYTFDIYDRGGSKVFSTNDVNEWWNGTEMNLGRESRSGLYNYVIVTRDKFRRDSKIFRGSITLIR